MSTLQLPADEADPRVVYDIAIVTRSEVFQLTSWVRASACLVVAAALLPHATAATFTACTVLAAGSALSFLHARDSWLDALERVHLPGTKWLHDHLTRARKKAGIDLPAIIEAIGVVSVAIAVMTADPNTLPVQAATVALLADAVFMIGYLINTTVDPTLLDPDGVPIFVDIGWKVLPIATTITCWVIFFYLPGWLEMRGAGESVADSLRATIAVSFLTMYLLHRCYLVVLRAGAHAHRAEQEQPLNDITWAIHGAISGPITTIQSLSKADPIDTDQMRSAALSLDSVRTELHYLRAGGSATTGTVEKLVDVAGGPFTHITAGSAFMLAFPSDYQQAKIMLSDLLSNALRHADSHLYVAVSQITVEKCTYWQWTLTDEGPGMTTGQMGPSLRHLQQELRNKHGGMELLDRSSGTAWVIWWPVGQAITEPDPNPDTIPPGDRVGAVVHQEAVTS